MTNMFLTGLWWRTGQADVEGSDKVCSGRPALMIRTCVAQIILGWADKRRRAMGTSGLKNGRGYE